MMGAVYDLLAHFRSELTWIINNRNEFSLPSSPVDAGAPSSAEPSSIEIPEILACSDCDAPSPPSLAAALQEGWTEIAAHKAERWNFIGLCPDCLESEYTLPRPTAPHAEEKPETENRRDPAQATGTLFD